MFKVLSQEVYFEEGIERGVGKGMKDLVKERVAGIQGSVRRGESERYKGKVGTDEQRGRRS